MEDRLEQLIGCLSGSGVGYGWPHAPRQHDAESPASHPAALADGEDTVQQLQSRLEEMERRLIHEAAGEDARGAVHAGAARDAAQKARPEARHAGRREQPLPILEAGPADAGGFRRGQPPPEALRGGRGSRPAVNTHSHAAKADPQDRKEGSGGHAATQHVERRVRAAAEAGSGVRGADARASVEERDVMQWQARHRRPDLKT